jgi:hypothetical protein
VAASGFVIWAWKLETRLADTTKLEELEGRETAMGKAQTLVGQQLTALNQHVAELERKLGNLTEHVNRLPDVTREKSEPADDSGGAIARLSAQIDELKNEIAELKNQQASQPLVTGWNRAQTAQAAESPKTQEGSNPGAPYWSVEQALGAPDTMSNGDHPTAWASRTADGGMEWIEMGFKRPISAQSILIRESYNPGAVVKVEAAGADGNYRVVWEGDDPTRDSPADFILDLDGSDGPMQTVKVCFNEIDAVGLISKGRTHWATSAKASSSYSESYGTALPALSRGLADYDLSK